MVLASGHSPVAAAPYPGSAAVLDAARLAVFLARALVWWFGWRLLVSSDQPCPVVEAVLEVPFEFQQCDGARSGGRYPAALAHDAAGKAGPRGTVKAPLVPLGSASLNAAHDHWNPARSRAAVAPAGIVTVQSLTASLDLVRVWR